jgi:hypothetical protein
MFWAVLSLWWWYGRGVISEGEVVRGKGGRGEGREYVCVLDG